MTHILEKRNRYIFWEIFFGPRIFLQGGDSNVVFAWENSNVVFAWENSNVVFA
jgi:hypothetical protein